MNYLLSYHSCVWCRYRRKRSKPELFSPSDLQTPGILTIKLEWDQQLRQRAEAETRRFEADQEFDYEPHHYDWCAAYTPDLTMVRAAQAGDEQAWLQIRDKLVVNPVTGEVSPIYALCARKNPDGQCERYEPE